MALTSQDLKKIDGLLGDQLTVAFKDVVTKKVLADSLKNVVTTKVLGDRLSAALRYFVTKVEFEEKINELEERISRLPTKDEFYKSMDRIMKELETIREEQILTPSHSDLANLEERVEILEKQIFHSNN